MPGRWYTGVRQLYGYMVRGHIAVYSYTPILMSMCLCVSRPLCAPGKSDRDT